MLLHYHSILSGQALSDWVIIAITLLFPYNPVPSRLLQSYFTTLLCHQCYTVLTHCTIRAILLNYQKSATHLYHSYNHRAASLPYYTISTTPVLLHLPTIPLRLSQCCFRPHYNIWAVTVLLPNISIRSWLLQCCYISTGLSQNCYTSLQYITAITMLLHYSIVPSRLS